MEEAESGLPDGPVCASSQRLKARAFSGCRAPKSAPRVCRSQAEMEAAARSTLRSDRPLASFSQTRRGAWRGCS